MLLWLPPNFSTPTGGMEACWCARIKETVLGFLSRQEEDLLDVFPHRFGQSVEFQKARSRTSLGPSSLKIARSDGIIRV
jgi:hypothetical protein